MSEAIIAALIGAGITLVTTLCTLFLNYRIQRDKIRYDYTIKQQETKKERLSKTKKAARLSSLFCLYSIYLYTSAEALASSIATTKPSWLRTLNTVSSSNIKYCPFIPFNFPS